MWDRERDIVIVSFLIRVLDPLVTGLSIINTRDDRNSERRTKQSLTKFVRERSTSETNKNPRYLRTNNM